MELDAVASNSRVRVLWKRGNRNADPSHTQRMAVEVGGGGVRRIRGRVIARTRHGRTCRAGGGGPVQNLRPAELVPAMRKMFDQLGGLGRLVKGKTVAIKINLTGSPTYRLGYLRWRTRTTLIRIRSPPRRTSWRRPAPAASVCWKARGPLPTRWKNTCFAPTGSRATSWERRPTSSSKIPTISVRARNMRASRFPSAATCFRRST